ncbi:MAG: hypothetical protein RR415_10100 [Ruthenibacterium sp.]
MTYNELDLKTIREKNGLDFAHYTFGRGQCSCCYGPFDMPARYWKNGVKPSKYIHGTEIYEDGRLVGGKPRELTYILFKNAYNGSGTVRAVDTIKNCTYVAYRVRSMEQLAAICADLQEQLGFDYFVEIPKSLMMCIIIWTTVGWTEHQTFGE